MRYNNLGHTGLIVSELCLGTMTFGQDTNTARPDLGGLDQAQANTLVSLAFDAGINFIDSANAYSGGRSEEIAGQALRDLGIPRDQVVIATKVFGPTGPGPNNRGNSRGHIMDSVKGSLTRLGVDHIDLYQIHGFDTRVPIEETITALDTLVRQGHVRYIGVSNWAAWQIAKAQGLADARCLTRLASNQAYYSLAGRDLERELVPMMESEKLGLLVWSPLAGGLLSGKYRDDADGGRRRDRVAFPPVNAERAERVLDAMLPIAQAHGVTPAQVAIAWLLHQSVVTSVIVGATRPDQLQANIAAAKLRLTPEDLAALERASALEPEYPGWILEFMNGIRNDAPVFARD